MNELNAEEEGESRKRQLKGKHKTSHLMHSILAHNNDICQVKKTSAENEYGNKQRLIRSALANGATQFKKQRIHKKVASRQIVIPTPPQTNTSVDRGTY